MIKLKLFNRDRLSTPVGQGVVSGIMEVCYIALVGLFMISTNSLFGGDNVAGSWLNWFGIIALLSLLVLSVAVSGVLVFGWPAHYFLEKRYREGISALIATVLSMFVIFAIIFLVALIVSLI